MNKKMKARISSGNSYKSTSSGRNSKNKKNHEDINIPIEVKKQILGFLILVIGILCFISVISYSDKDQSKLDSFNIVDLFRKEGYANTNITYNWLGIVGAFISNFLINNLFGYFTIIVTIILTFFGLVLLRKKSLLPFSELSIYSFILMSLLGSSFGLMKIFWGSNTISSKLSGTTGDFFASIFYQIFGGIGAIILFLTGIVLIVFLMIDRSIIKTLARIKFLFDKIKDRFRQEKEALLQREDEQRIKKLEQKFIQSGEKTELEDALEKEKKKIQKVKFAQEEDLEENLIKETKINRPRPDDIFNQENEKKQKSKKKINDEEEKQVDLTKLLDKTQINREEPDEIDINPENSNEIEQFKDYAEEDFVEEKLENYKTPDIGLLDEPTKEEFEVISDEELTENGRLLQEKLLKFGIEIEKVFATPGPVVTLYELVPAPDVKLSKIESLQDDIALAMKAKGIRMIIPIPGKGTVGVEIPNSKAQMVRIRSIIGSQKYSLTKSALPIAFGKTIDGEVFIDDLAKMPHILIAGATGSGKSVGINNIIASLIYKIHPTDLKFVMVDPKKIELSLYSHLKKHFLATSPDINESIITTPSNAVSVLKSVELEMERRYDKLANAGVRNIDAYNKKYKDGLLKNNEFIKHRKMPYVVVIIDELADLMITAKREIEEPIARIAQMARAVGIHMIVATQRPSVDVITGVIKANFPIRIAYQVASKIDSRTILDMGGAEQLLRNGDMLYLSSASPKPIRIQNAYISTEECERVTEFISKQDGFSKPYLLPSIVEKRSLSGDLIDDRDELFEEAAKLVVKLGQCSTSTLQRRLKLGYARAARIVDQMEEAGIVGPNNGAKGREILISESDLEQII